MRKNIMQIIWAVLVGLVMPGVIMAVVGNSATAPETTAPYTSSFQESTPPDKPGLWVLTQEQEIKWMDMEDYLVGVLLAEMPTSYETEALQAQAVVARTYALKRQEEARHEKGAVCTDPGCCQAYVTETTYLDGLGYPADVDIARNAVTSTEDHVVTYEGEVIEATYFHSSGGRTEDASEVWGVAYPYLQTVFSPGEEEMEHYTDRVYYSKEDLEKCLGRKLPGSPSGWLSWMDHTAGGGVDTLVFAGISYAGTRFRDLLGLYSTAFQLEPGEGGLWITTYGKGHRVGMSQSGAQAMALQGRSWQEIIAHYYPGTRIDKMELVG